VSYAGQDLVAELRPGPERGQPAEPLFHVFVVVHRNSMARSLGNGWLGSNEVSPQLSGGSLALDPGHPKSHQPNLELYCNSLASQPRSRPIAVR